MFKKLFYVGLGISFIVAKKSVSYLMEGKEWAGDQVKNVKDTAANLPQTLSRADSQPVTKEPVASTEATPALNKADDLTKIDGIGPTYSQRLKNAGITTFAALAQKTPDELRSAAKAPGKSADTEYWIAQARDMA